MLLGFLTRLYKRECQKNTEAKKQPYEIKNDAVDQNLLLILKA
jgi:hypothetical protein